MYVCVCVCVCVCVYTHTYIWLPSWLRQQRIYLQCKRLGFNPWVGQIPWRRAQQPTLVFLPAESPWTEESGGLVSMGSQRVGYDWAAKPMHTQGIHMFIFSYHCKFSIGIVQFGLLPALLYTAVCSHPQAVIFTLAILVHVGWHFTIVLIYITVKING